MLLGFLAEFLLHPYYLYFILAILAEFLLHPYYLYFKIKKAQELRCSWAFLLFAYCVCDGLGYFVRAEFQVSFTIRVVIKEEQLYKYRLCVRVSYHV